MRRRSAQLEFKVPRRLAPAYVQIRRIVAEDLDRIKELSEKKGELTGEERTEIPVLLVKIVKTTFNKVGNLVEDYNSAQKKRLASRLLRRVFPGLTFGMRASRFEKMFGHPPSAVVYQPEEGESPEEFTRREIDFNAGCASNAMVQNILFSELGEENIGAFTTMQHAIPVVKIKGVTYVLDQQQRDFPKVLNLDEYRAELVKAHGDSSHRLHRLARVMAPRDAVSMEEISRAMVWKGGAQASLSAAYVNLGSAYRYWGKLKKAENYFKKALELHPDNFQAHNGLGKTLREKGEREEAIKHFQKAAEINPQWAIAHTELADALFWSGRAREAEPHFRKATELEPGNFKAHYGLGRVLFNLGRKEDAAESYRKAIEINPDYPLAHSSLGVTLHSLGNVEEAMQHFKIAELLVKQKNAGR